MNFFNTLVATLGALFSAAGDTGGLENNLNTFGGQLKGLYDTGWPWLLGIGILLVVIWGAFCGVKIMRGITTEKKQEAKSAIKNLILGILIIFIAIAGLPLVVSGIAQWAGIQLITF